VAGEGAAVVVRNGEGEIVKSIPARSLAGHEVATTVTVIKYLAARRSFVVGFAGLAELWELSVDPAAPLLFDGMVHDFRLGEGLASPGFLGVRRTRLDAPVRELAIDARHAYALTRAIEDTPDGRARLALVQLDVRREIARWEVTADPEFDSAKSVDRANHPYLDLPDRRRGGATITIDLRAATLALGD
jgi:hypothetical protein